MSTLSDTLARLRMVREGDGGWYALCPVHDDHNSSLSVAEGRDGRVLVFCHRCSHEMGKDEFVREFFRVVDGKDLSTEAARRVAEYERKPKKDTRDWQFERKHVYCDADGRPRAEKVRYRVVDQSTGEIGKRWAWKHYANPDGEYKRPLPGLNGYDPGLYRAWLLGDHEPYVVLTEGEKDADALVDAGVVAVSIPDGAPYTLTEADLAVLGRADQVVVVQDNDDTGRDHAQKAARQAGGRVVAPPEGFKDVADALEAEVPWEKFESVPLEDESGGGDEGDLSWVAERFPATDWEALWEAEDDGLDWLVYPIIPRRRHIHLYSKAKAGKSLLARELAASLSCGRYFLGTTLPVARVLYLDFENDPLGDVRDSLRDMGFTPADLTNFVHLPFPSMAYLNTAAGAADLDAAVRFYRPDLVVVDTVARTVRGEENSNDTWHDWYKHSGLVLKRHEVALLRFDHEGHQAGRSRGGSAKSGDVDAIWRLVKHTETNLELSLDDARYKLMPEERQVSIHRGGHPLTHTADARQWEAWNRSLDAIVAAADAAGLPVGAGYRKVEEAAKDAHVECTQRLAQQATQRRKERAS